MANTSLSSRAQRPNRRATSQASASIAPTPAHAPSPARTAAHNERPAQSVEVTAIASPSLSAAEKTAISLSPSQVLAIEKMLAGNTLSASASAAGVTRWTLHHWLRHDARFQAAYNAWQLDAVTRVRTKLLGMADTAADSVAKALPTDPRLAFSMLKALGTLDRPTPGSTNPEEVEQVMDLEKQKAEEKLGEQMFFASIGGGFKPPSKGKKLKDSDAEKLIAEMESLPERFE